MFLADNARAVRYFIMEVKVCASGREEKKRSVSFRRRHENKFPLCHFVTQPFLFIHGKISSYFASQTCRQFYDTIEHSTANTKKVYLDVRYLIQKEVKPGTFGCLNTTFLVSLEG